MTMPKKISEFLTEPVTAPAVPAKMCTACGSAYPTGKDGACFDCRIPDWTDEQAIANKKFGPGIIGKAAHEYAWSVAEKTGDGRFGPALLGQIPEAYRDQRKSA